LDSFSGIQITPRIRDTPLPLAIYPRLFPQTLQGRSCLLHRPVSPSLGDYVLKVVGSFLTRFLFFGVCSLAVFSFWILPVFRRAFNRFFLDLEPLAPAFSPELFSNRQLAFFLGLASPSDNFLSGSLLVNAPPYLSLLFS